LYLRNEWEPLWREKCGSTLIYNATYWCQTRHLILDNSIHHITFLSYKIFTVSFVLVITKGSIICFGYYKRQQRKQSQKKMKCERYQEKIRNITCQQMGIKFRLRYLPHPCMKQGCKVISMSIIYLKQVSTGASTSSFWLTKKETIFQIKIIPFSSCLQHSICYKVRTWQKSSQTNSEIKWLN